jgi:drug/metabolite transporter (DMT)-like permease
MTFSGRSWGLLFAMAGAIGFSGKAIIVKLSYRYGVDATQVIFYRMAFALPFFLALAWWAGRGQVALTRRQWWMVGSLGFSGYYLASMLDFLGLQYISASLERLILYLNPTIVVLLSRWLFKRHATRAQWVGMALSYTGVLLVFGHELQLDGCATAVGAGLVLASTLSYAYYLMYSGEMIRQIGSLRVVGLATTIACVLCMVQLPLTQPWSALAVPSPVLWLGLLNATACTAMPVLLVMLAVERLGAGLASQTGMVGPMSTIAMGIVLLDEPFNRWIVVGTVLVLSGVAWTSWRDRVKPSARSGAA